MKFRKPALLIVTIVALTTLMSTTCNKEEEPDPGNCTGYVSATASGAVSASICFDLLNSYNYTPNTSVSLWARQTGSIYGFDISINPNDGSDITTGTYQCGSGPGFVELIVETETDSEFYKSKEGTITVTKIDADHFEATFNVKAEGYYNKETINYSGTVIK